MTIGLIGRKAGMTRVFTDAGESIPVTVIEALPNRVTQVKGVEGDGYRAVQVTYGSKKPSRVTRAVAGHYAKAKVEPGEVAGRVPARRRRRRRSRRRAPSSRSTSSPPGQVVDVTGTTVGKGFAGTIKRHNFAGGPASHGASVFHRAPGSIGQRQTPGRVFQGKRMSGHMGTIRRTIEKLQVVEIDAARNLLLIRGAVPGAPGGEVIVRPSVKAARLAKRKTLAPKQPAAKTKK